MKKLELDLSGLQVESFDTEAAGPKRSGTVHGHCSVYTENGPQCPGYTNGGCGHTPYCPGYGCTNTSTCRYPTHVDDDCEPTWTDDETACWVAEPVTYYCAGTGGGGTLA